MIFLNNASHVVQYDSIMQVYTDSVFLNFTKNLKACRLMLGYTQQQFAEMCRLTRGSYMQIEKGVTDPSVRTLIKLAYNLEIDYNSLLNGYFKI